MMEINNKHIVLIFIIIIVGIFICNYDVYVVQKNQPLCKPIYVTKREISPEIRAELNKEESGVLKETFENLTKSGYLEEFGNMENIENSDGKICINNNYDIPPKSFSSFVVTSITNKDKLKVIDSVIKILSYIPTNYCESQIKQLVEYFGIIYQNSPDLKTFYKNISSSTKIKEEPYNSKYSHLILFLIGKFDTDYSNNNIQITNNTENTNNTDNTENSKKIPNITNEAIDVLMDNNNLSPTNLLNLVKKMQSNQIFNENKKNESDKILPINNINSNSDSNLNQDYLPDQNYLPNQDYLSSNYPNSQNSQNIFQIDRSKKCYGQKCNYKCDSSYNDKIAYLNKESKPLEGFGNIGSGYAPF